jgi:GT2 family glycosyltransferase
MLARLSPLAASFSPAPRLSVVTAVFNCLPLTQAMVAGLRATLPPGLTHEIILVDDGSTDGTREWLATLGPPFRVVLNAGNLGYAAANNHGATLARGEFLALLNNDLVLRPGWLEPMLAAHRALGPRAGIIGNVQTDARTGAVDHAGIAFNHQGKPEHDRAPPSPWSRWFRPVRPVPAATGACLLLTTALWRELGGFDEAYMNGCEDIDLCLRAAAAGRFNAVALRSVIGHHISSSPGRKRRDEANTQRLAQRWRATLVRLSVPAWCRSYLSGDPITLPDQALARQCLWFLLRLRRTPPPGACAGVQATLELELQRWQSIGSGN